VGDGRGEGRGGGGLVVVVIRGRDGKESVLFGVQVRTGGVVTYCVCQGNYCSQYLWRAC
jgi:hypothetical protein